MRSSSGTRRDFSEPSYRQVTLAKVTVLGTALAAFGVAIVWGCSHFNLVSSLQSKPLASGLLFLWLVWSAVRRARRVWGNVVVDCVHQVDHVMMRVSSSQTISRIKSSVSSMCLMNFANGRDTLGRAIDAQRELRTPKIALPTPFLSSDTISALSLSDIKHLVHYTMEANGMNFDNKVFTSTLNKPCISAIEAMLEVVSASRGLRATTSRLPVGDKAKTAGDMDALMFVAFVRIFAEWRSLRLVPDGYQGYAVGMGLAKRDLIQNILKIETAVHMWMESNEQNQNHAFGSAQGRSVQVRSF
jgi:hypothetical protein